jgi:hypothetical protein
MTVHAHRRALLITCLSCVLQLRAKSTGGYHITVTHPDVVETGLHDGRYVVIDGWMFAVPAVDASTWD